MSLSKQGTDTIDFANSKAVKLLNTALLKADYGIHFWEFPRREFMPTHSWTRRLYTCYKRPATGFKNR
ncbi:RlmF-related methyltransferase [Lacinutrix neustonica]|uniref:RlmF-related methyltransferase n=1 Tax=Lacinutrix neustonica TaxID=2980107 RepID=A0A9E8MWN2_9FLAO|nr:RlmF-related methyltransferase [Lacinutrix neustonica]WAC02305.1 RlmF-related methyltransferase [Lacinutrix neustonica]